MTAALTNPVTSDGPAGLPEHLVALACAPAWALWRSTCLRSAGFPVDLMARLAEPECVTAADLLVDAQAAADRTRADALTAVNAELDAARALGGTPSTRTHKDLVNLSRALRAGRLPAPAGGGPDTAAEVAALIAATGRRDDAERAFQAAYAAAADSTAATIRELAGDPLLREAMIWQNRHAYRRAVPPLLADDAPDRRNRRQRRDEQFLVQTISRYATKNDTIGFFGPIGWAEFTDDGPALDLRHGPGLLRRRAVHFEQWGVDQLADTLAGRMPLDDWARPRRLPTTHVDGSVGYTVAGDTIDLSPAEAAVLAACTGRRTARDLAAGLARAGVPGLGGPDDVRRTLTGLRDRGLIVWRLEVPFGTDPDAALHRRLAAVDDPTVGPVARRSVEVLRGAKEAVARAAGSPERLDDALARLEQTFSKLTGAEPTRKPGQIYAARTLVYEDCVRDTDVRIGPELLADLAAPLSLVLDSARWLTWTAAQGYDAALLEIYRGLVAGSGRSRVPAAQMWRRLPEIFPFLATEPDPGGDGAGESRGDGAVVRAACAELTRRWEDVLGLADPALAGARRVAVTTDRIADRARAAFAAPHPGWELARYHSPDLMIAAAGPDAVRRGDYLAVLGEVHLAGNSLGAALFVDEHPRREQVAAWTAYDLPEPSVVAVSPRQWRGNTSRTRGATYLPRDYYLLMSDEFVDDPAVPDDHRIALAELSFVADRGELWATTYDQRLRTPARHLLGELMSLAVINSLRFSAPAAHSPRITVDKLVIQREAWRSPVGEAAFVDAGNEADRFVQARRWAAGLGLPRRLFYSVATEDKPLLLDLDSPVLVEIFVKVLRRAAREGSPRLPVTLTEMLPGPDETWLTDAAGRPYTSELRVVAVDHAGRASESR